MWGYLMYKSDLLQSKRFAHVRDILMVVLKDNQLYTIEQVEKLVKKFLEREVK